MNSRVLSDTGLANLRHTRLGYLNRGISHLTTDTRSVNRTLLHEWCFIIWLGLGNKCLGEGDTVVLASPIFRFEEFTKVTYRIKLPAPELQEEVKTPYQIDRRGSGRGNSLPRLGRHFTNLIRKFPRFSTFIFRVKTFVPFRPPISRP